MTATDEYPSFLVRISLQYENSLAEAEKNNLQFFDESFMQTSSNGN